MKRRLWVSLIGTVTVVVAAFAGNLIAGNEPVLGLDLQGGLSVILAPDDNASGADLVVVRDLVRSSLEKSGVAEPDVRVQGSNIVVDLPGVKDKEEALKSVSVSGIVDLRPVVSISECASALPPGDGTAPADDGAVVGNETITSDPATTGGPSSVEPAVENSVAGEPAGLLRSPDTVPASVPDSVPASTPGSVPSTDSVPATIPVPALGPVPGSGPSASGAELLPNIEGSAVCVGPSQASGEVFARDSASVSLDQVGGFTVNVDLRGDGQASWNALATQCYNRTPLCPSTATGADGSARPGQIAIVLDDIVQSDPVVNTPTFDGAVSITGSFSQKEADQLSSVLNRGAFPVAVTPQETRTVSASAGGDSLRAAVIAGIVGLGLVLALLVAYYRWLALIIAAGLTIWAMTVFSVASFVSEATNYALSLAGVTGIIVAIGVTVDSYIIIFERMKDEIRNGRTLRNAGPRSFASTWRTIWSADLISIIGALILFSLSVGSVRGFALYLGITTLCDLLVCYFFTRPAVVLLARSKFMAGKRAFGLEVAQ